jgi:mycothiol synthase
VTSTLSSLTVRSPTLDDAQRALELMIRHDVADYGVPDSSLEDVQYDWEHIDLERDAWLALAPGGEPAGYAAVAPMLGGLHYNVYVDPRWRASGLSAALLERCEQRAGELVRDGASGPTIRAFVAHVNERERALVESAGFRAVRYHFQMRSKLDRPPAPPEWPGGISVRTVRPGDDDRAIQALIEAAFDRPGRTPQTFEDWQEFMMQPGLFKPELWFLAEAGGELVGACLGFIYEPAGWIRQLAVADSWRRRGLGTALLRHAFQEFWRRGLDHVGLGVAADNERAVHLYEAAGMRRLQQYDEYLKTIDAGT